MEERAIISRENFRRQVDLQPVLQAIVSQSLPEVVHQRVCADVIDEMASIREAAKLDETKEAETHKLLEPERKKMRAEQRLQRQLGTRDGE